jgi:DNA-binding NtrC family response regulator
MTTAHDPTPGPSHMDRQTIEAVRTALVDYVAEPAASERLRLALRALAAEARTKSVLPEQLLIVLKDMWYSLPCVQQLREQADQVRLLQRAVTMCIKEYYAD